MKAKSKFKAKISESNKQISKDSNLDNSQNKQN
jgi:hypothetical protein